MNLDENLLYQRLLTRLRKSVPVQAGTATSIAWDAVTGKPTLFDGAWNSLSGRPTTFATTWALVSGKPALFSGSYADLTSKPNLFSGTYADLTGKPALFDGTWDSLSGKPSLFSGAYADLTGKPVLFDGSYASLTGKPQLPRAIRAQTNAAGLYVWTFDTPFSDTVIPVVEGMVEDSSMGSMFSMRITAVTNKSATIQLSKSVGVSVAGISVLGAAVGVQAYVHLTATAP